MSEDYGKPNIERIWDILMRHERDLCGNGQPGLEKRLIAYIDHEAAHVKNNYEQDLQDNEMRQNDRHKENKEKFDSIMATIATQSKFIYIGLGILMALNAIGLAAGWKH